MGGAFGKYKKRVRVSEQNAALNRLKQQRVSIIEVQLKTEEVIDMDRQTAMQFLREGRRDEAKKVLIRKRFRERQLQRSNAQLDQIDQLTEGLEVMTELAQRREEKVKRGKWKLFSKKHKKGDQNTGSQSNAVDVENFEIQNLDGFNKKGIQKILARTQNGVEKQKKIDYAISHRLRTVCSNEAMDRAVEEELEAILHADYQLPEVRQVNISNASDNTFENPQGLENGAETAVGG